jgi:hypothetical protein
LIDGLEVVEVEPQYGTAAMNKPARAGGGLDVNTLLEFLSAGAMLNWLPAAIDSNPRWIELQMRLFE